MCVPVVSAYHPVRVQHGDEFEDKHVAECVSSGVVMTQDEV